MVATGGAGRNYQGKLGVDIARSADKAEQE